MTNDVAPVYVVEHILKKRWVHRMAASSVRYCRRSSHASGAFSPRLSGSTGQPRCAYEGAACKNALSFILVAPLNRFEQLEFRLELFPHYSQRIFLQFGNPKEDVNSVSHSPSLLASWGFHFSRILTRSRKLLSNSCTLKKKYTSSS